MGRCLVGEDTGYPSIGPSSDSEADWGTPVTPRLSMETQRSLHFVGSQLSFRFTQRLSRRKVMRDI